MEQIRKVTFTFLKERNNEIKSDDFKLRDKAYKSLMRVECKGLDPNILMYYFYLQGKYHYLNFKRNNTIDSIARAVECYSEVFRIARYYRTYVEEPKYYFKYAETLHLKSLYIFCLFKQNELWNKAYKIAYYSSKRYPNNSSFIWLERHIKNS